MRILVATGLYPPDIGGPATYTRIIEQELPRRGFEVVVASFRDVRRLPKGVRHLVYLGSLLRKAKGVDVIYALDPISVGLPAMIASRLLNKRFLLRVPGDRAWETAMQKYPDTEELSSFSTTPARQKLIRLMQKVQTMVALSAQQIIVPSEYLKMITWQWGVPKEQITVIYNAFDPPKDMEQKEALRGLLRFEGKVLISVGRLVPWKGFKALIESMPALAAEYKEIRLLIVGEGPDRRELQQLIDKTDMSKYVSLVGSLDKATLLKYIAAADLFVLNTFYEGFSHQILEAMSVGVPVITTDRGGNPELVEHNKEGVLLEYNDHKALVRAIMHAFSDAKKTASMSRQAQKKANSFTSDRAVTALISVLSMQGATPK